MVINTPLAVMPVNCHICNRTIDNEVYASIISKVNNTIFLACTECLVKTTFYCLSQHEKIPLETATLQDLINYLVDKQIGGY